MKLAVRPVVELAAEPAKKMLPAWLMRAWTWKRAGALVFLWVSMALLVVVHLVSRAVVGAIEGFGNGLVQGIEDTWRDFCKYWAMFEECE